MIGTDGPNPAEDLIEVGRILKPRGVRGEVLVRPDREGYFPFDTGARVWVGQGAEARPMQVARFFLHRGTGVLKLDGLNSVEEARASSGAALSLPSEDVEPEPEGLFDPSSVVGFEVEDARRGKIGTVLAGRPGPAYWVLDAQGSRGPFEIPAVAGLGVEVRAGERTVRCDLPSPWPGLDEREGDPRGADAG